jgi:hypothetical protein
MTTGHTAPASQLTLLAVPLVRAVCCTRVEIAVPSWSPRVPEDLASLFHFTELYAESNCLAIFG